MTKKEQKQISQYEKQLKSVQKKIDNIMADDIVQKEDVIEYCRGKLSKYKWPQFFMFLDEFPMTGSGKIQKFKLTEMGTKYRREVMKIDD